MDRVMAQHYSWKTIEGSGNWSTASDWGTSPATGDYPGQTGTTDTVQLKAPSTAGASYTVTFDVASATIGSITLAGFGNNLTTLSLASGNTLTVDSGIVNIGSSNSGTGAAL